MSKQSINKVVPGSVPLPHYVLKRNAKGEVPNYWDWDELIHDRAQLKFHDIYQELTTPPAVETEVQAMTRRLQGITPITLVDERSKVLGDAAWIAVQAVDEANRARAMDVAIDAMQTARRADNAVSAVVNTDRRIMYESRAARDIAKEADRPKLSAWLLSDECLSSSALEEVKADGLYTAGTITPAAIMEIVRRVFGLVSTQSIKQRMDFEAALRGIKQGSMPTHLYSSKFKRAHMKCTSAGSTLLEAELIATFVYNLNLTMFEEYIRSWSNDPVGHPQTLGLIMAHVLEYQKNIVLINPELTKILDHSLKGFIAYSTDVVDADEDESESSAPSTSSTGTTVSTLSTGTPTAPADKPAEKPIIICQICGKVGHLAPGCFKLNSAEFVKTLTAVSAKDSNYQPRTRNKTKKSASPPPIVSSVDLTADIDLSRGDPIVVCSVHSCTTMHADFEHDDHAQVSVVNEEALWMFDSILNCDEEVIGVVPGSCVKVSQRGTLKLDMGRAVVIKGAPRLLASAPELRRAYNMCSSGSSIVYTHKVTGSTLIFQLDRVRFSDDYFHLLIDDPVDEFVGALDFYNPPPLLPVLPSDAAASWPMIRAVERLHWTTNHMSAEAMTRICKSPGYYGDATVEGIKLFVKHRGCSACSMGKMVGHSQLESSRGLDTEVGRTAQGDVFFIDDDDRKIPVLLVTCEASLFQYLHIFEDAAARSKGPRVMINAAELHHALDGVVNLWNNAGHPLKMLRFDRESAITSTDVREYMQQSGIELVLTAAGQKLGLAEVMGKHLKDASRATVAGILQMYGYRFCLKWFTRLIADTVCLFNRTQRRGEVLSPAQKFFTPASSLDVRRDLRAALGEVLLCKSPKVGASTTISKMKSEWGVVVSRAFNGTGVLEVYLIESKSYGHRFKFERHIVPSYVMELLRGLSLSNAPITRELTEEDSHPSNAGVPPSVEAPVLEDKLEEDLDVPDLLEDADLDAPDLLEDAAHDSSTLELTLSVLSAQMSYRKALLTSPERAIPAMEAEIRMLFGEKKLGRPVHYADILPDDRKFILRNLDGYKEKFALNGDCIKAKARIFADGSKQLPEFTAESSSPVARIESIYAIAGIAAFKGWKAIRFDVVCGYPNTPRPNEVLYKYMRLTKDITAILVQVFPEYAEFVDNRGSLIVELDRLIYGMKEAGYYFYLLMMDMFRAAGFVSNPMDPCVIHRYQGQWEAHCGITVDDCFVTASSDAGIAEMHQMFTSRFGKAGYTFMDGDNIDLLGLLFTFDRENKRVLVSQRKLVADLLKKAGITSFAKTPCGPDLFDVPSDAPLVSDPDLYRSLLQSFAFAASRTYPECLSVCSVMAARFLVATEPDFKKLLRAISYLGYDPNHCLVIHPGSLSLVCSADASYGVHADGKSHSGVCVGFKGCGDLPDSYFVFSSGKQTIVTTSSCEAELVCANKGAAYLVWLAQLFEGFGLRGPASEIYRNGDSTPYANEVIDLPLLHQDNRSTMHLISKGHGNFKNTKHIRVRYYYIRELVLGGELVVKWLSTTDMVADLLTKGAAYSVFSYLLPKLIGKR
jgi:hypothetical protein